ncbi:EamA family transporter [Candidatus Uhrbacteria bacterium]|nr:EamA family transporter [Candidatus Uhrbacteria bacterium]
MLWFPFALFSAVILASRRTYEKNLTNSFGNFSMGFIVQSFSLLPTLVLFFFFPIPDDFLHLPWQFWWPLLIIWFVLYPIQTYFLYRGLREGELSQTVPIMALMPVFNLASSFLLLGERPSLMGMVGIGIIVLGTYLLLMEGTQKEHGKRYNKAVMYTIIATFCVAIGSTLDKISINVSTPVFYSFMNTLGASVVFLVLMNIYRQRDDIPKMLQRFWPFTILGIFQALLYTAKMLAFSFGPTSYVVAVLSSSFLFAALFGIIFLKEKCTIRKMSSFGLFVFGIILITVTR